MSTDTVIRHGDRAIGTEPRHAPRSLQAKEILLVITVLAVALRFATLNVQSIWGDEAATMVLVQRGLGGMLSHLSTSESTPPLYYVLVWAWTKLFGYGPFAFRSFSALVGAATVPVAYAAGRRISVRAGLWCAALLALNPAMLYFSQEARAYALLILLSSAAFVAWQQALEDRSGRSLTVWALLSALALLSHYFAVFPLIPEAMILAVRLGWRRLVLPTGALLVVGAALLPLAISQRNTGSTDWIAASSLASRFADVPKLFLIGLYSPLELFSAAFAGLLAAASIVLLWRYADARQRRVAFDAGSVGIVALAVPALLALTHLLDVLNGRNMVEVWTPWAVLVAGGIAVGRPGRLGATIGATVCVVFVAVIVGTETTPAYQRDDWRGVVRSLRKLSAQSRVIVTDQAGSTPLSVYLPSLRETRSSLVTTREVDFVSLRTPRTARTPLPPSAPREQLAGFTLVASTRTSTYAVYQFVAPEPKTLSVAVLRNAAGYPSGDISLLP